MKTYNLTVPGMRDCVINSDGVIWDTFGNRKTLHYRKDGTPFYWLKGRRYDPKYLIESAMAAAE